MFEKIIGNEENKNILIQATKNNKVSHSYMFLGNSGIGKKCIAKEFAKSILCIGEDKYCNKCKSCIEYDGQNNPDFTIIEPDGNSIKIEQIREMQKRIQEKPIISKNKVYIIDNADLMTKEAQNCLLKTLEEPPEFITIILIGSNENGFLTTIKSRCMIMHFKPIENDKLANFLRENYNINNVTQSMLELFQGSIGKAIELKDKEEQYSIIAKAIEQMKRKDLIDIAKDLEILYKSKDEIYEMLDYINVILLRMAKADYSYTNCIQIVENTKKRLKQNGNYDMCIDDMLFNMWEELI